MNENGTAVKLCRRCLLQDMADEIDFYQSILSYRETMLKEERAPDDLYEARLLACKSCESLQNGTCRQCGCFVEIRAARVDMHCPRPDAAW